MVISPQLRSTSDSKIEANGGRLLWLTSESKVEANGEVDWLRLTSESETGAAGGRLLRLTSESETEANGGRLLRSTSDSKIEANGGRLLRLTSESKLGIEVDWRQGRPRTSADLQSQGGGVKLVHPKYHRIRISTASSRTSSHIQKPEFQSAPRSFSLPKPKSAQA